MKNKITWEVRKRLGSATTYWLGFYDDEYLFRITGHWYWIGGSSYTLAYVPNKKPQATGQILESLMLKAEERLNWALQMERAQEKMIHHETPSDPENTQMGDAAPTEA